MSTKMSSSWAHLPKELLLHIAQLIDTNDQDHTDLRHFRAVCHQWRYATSNLPLKSPPLLPLQLHLPLTVSNTTVMMSPFTLFKTTVFRIEEPDSSSKNSWLIKLSEQFNAKFTLMNPFSSNPINHLPNNGILIPKVLNLLNFRISELCQRFYLRLNGSAASTVSFAYKAALPSDFVSTDQKFLAIDQRSRLRCPKYMTRFWIRIEKCFDFIDVDYYKNKFYAINSNGAVRVFDESSLATSVVLYQPHDRLCRCGDWYLLKSCGDLYLVGKIVHTCRETDVQEAAAFAAATNNKAGYYVVPEFPNEVFKIYKLNESHQVDYIWDPVIDLGERIFFISRDCSYAVSAQDFANCEGNCIIFVEEPRGLDDNVSVGFYDMNTGRVIRPLASMPSYFKMFWPPPTWMSFNDDQCTSSTS